MGKKSAIKRPEIDYADADDQEELEAEIAAVLQSRAEKEGSGLNDDSMSQAEDKYNKEGLLQCLEAVGTESLPFIQTLAVTEFELDVQDQNDDLQRELSFYNHAISAVNSARKILEDQNIPTRRPSDYFCEQVKSDNHMAKLKDKLIIENKKIEAFELRKQREINRTFNKQVSTLRKEEKNKNTKQEIDNVTAMRKKRSHHQIRNDNDENTNEKSFNKGFQKKNDGEKSLKRVRMDKKYGFGGKEGRNRKLNDKKSINDMSSFKPRGDRPARKGKGANRPGKDSRKKMRTQRKQSS